MKEQYTEIFNSMTFTRSHLKTSLQVMFQLAVRVADIYEQVYMFQFKILCLNHLLSPSVLE